MAALCNLSASSIRSLSPFSTENAEQNSCLSFLSLRFSSSLYFFQYADLALFSSSSLAFSSSPASSRYFQILPVPLRMFLLFRALKRKNRNCLGGYRCHVCMTSDINLFHANSDFVDRT